MGLRQAATEVGARKPARVATERQCKSRTESRSQMLWNLLMRELCQTLGET